MKNFWLTFIAADFLLLMFLQNFGSFVLPVGNAEILLALPWQTLPPPGGKTPIPDQAQIDAPSTTVRNVVTVERTEITPERLPPQPRDVIPAQQMIKPAPVRVKPESNPAPQAAPESQTPAIYKCAGDEGRYILQNRPC